MSVKRTFELVLLWTLSVFYTLFMCVSLFVSFVKSPRKFLSYEKQKVRPQCLDDPAFKHGYIRLKNLRMHYVQTGDDSKPLMLLVHGFPECWYSWRHQLRAFSKDYRVVAIDNRGYNETEEPQGVEEYMIEKMREDIKQFIDAMGYSQCILVGHDWGGALSWDFAANYPEYVAKLITLCGPNEAMEGFMRKSFKQFRMSWYMFFFQMPYIPEVFFYREDMMNMCFGPLVAKELMSESDLQAMKYAFRKSVTGAINYYRAAFQYKSKTKMGKGNHYTMPTLVLWAEKDVALSVELGQQVAAKAEGCTFYVVPGAHHFLQQECPDVVNKCMKEWLSTGTLKM